MKKAVGSLRGRIALACRFALLALLLAACRLDVSNESSESSQSSASNNIRSTREALSTTFTLDTSGLATPSGIQQVFSIELGVFALDGGTISFSAGPGTHSFGPNFQYTYGTFTVGNDGLIIATTGALVASTPTSLTFDHSRLASVTIPLSKLISPNNGFLFSFAIWGVTRPPMVGGAVTGGDVTLSLPTGHYTVSNSQASSAPPGTLVPGEWGSFDVSVASITAGSGVFKASDDGGHLDINRCALASVHIQARPPPMGAPFGMPGLFNQMPVPTTGGDFFLLPGTYSVATFFPGMSPASFTVPPGIGPITNVVQQPWLEPITGGTGLVSCVETPAASCVGTPEALVVLSTEEGTCGANLNASTGRAGTCTSSPPNSLASCTYDGVANRFLPPGGPYAVEVAATSTNGSVSRCTSYISIVDRQPPTIYCFAPSPTRECVGPRSSLFAFAPCFDNCGQCSTPLGTCEPRDAPLGPATITCTGSDLAGNVGTCTTSVTVVDTLPPNVAVSASPSTLWPPDQQLHHIELTKSVSDLCDPAAAITCSASSDAGDASMDITWIDGELYLRATSGSPPSDAGRTYTITCTGTDASGNSSSASTTVIVPRSQPEL